MDHRDPAAEWNGGLSLTDGSGWIPRTDRYRRRSQAVRQSERCDYQYKGGRTVIENHLARAVLSAIMRRIGHPYRRAVRTPFPVVLDASGAQEALRTSLGREAQVRAAIDALPVEPTDSPYSPFGAIASDPSYDGDPALVEPSPFFTTLHGYVQCQGALMTPCETTRRTLAPGGRTITVALRGR